MGTWSIEDERVGRCGLSKIGVLENGAKPLDPKENAREIWVFGS